MKIIDYCTAVISVLIFVIISDCTNPVAGVETTNGATVVMREDRVEGTSPPFASVYLFDTSYIPYIDTGLGVVTVSDGAGLFSLGQIAVKNINVQVVDHRKQYTVLIAVGADGETHKSELKRPGALSGSVEMSKAGKVMVFLCGSGYYALLDGNSEFSLREVPPGSYKIQAVLLSYATSDKKPIIVSSSVKVPLTIVSGEVTVLKEKIVIP